MGSLKAKASSFIEDLFFFFFPETAESTVTVEVFC